MGRIALHLIAGTLLTLLAQTASGYLGPSGILFHFFVPLPAAHAYLCVGPAAGGGIVLLTMGVLSVVADPLGGAAYAIQFGVGSLVLSLLLSRGRPWDAAVAGAVAASALAGAAGIFGFSTARGTGVAEYVNGLIKTEVDRTVAIYQKAQLPQEQIVELTRLAEGMMGYLRIAWPALAILATGGIFLLTVFFLGKLSRGRYEMPGPPFGAWKTPDWIVWFLILGGAGTLLAQGWPYVVAVNLLTVMLPVYFLQGLAIVTWFFRARNISPLLRNIGYLLVVVLNPLPLIVTGMGVFDLWVDFRKSGIKKT